MKKIIGTVAILLALAFIIILTLRMWGIDVISMQTLIKSNLTLVLLGVLIIILTIIYGGLFKKNKANYDDSVGNRAHPKKNL